MRLNEEALIKKINETVEEKKNIEEKIRKLQNKKKKKKLEEKLSENQKKRKERVHHLISIGGLVQVANIDTEDKDTLLGFFLKFHHLSQEEKDDCKFSGQLEFRKRKEKKEQEIFLKKIEKMIKEK